MNNVGLKFDMKLLIIMTLKIGCVEMSTPRDYQIKYGNKLYLLN